MAGSSIAVNHGIIASSATLVSDLGTQLSAPRSCILSSFPPPTLATGLSRISGSSPSAFKNKHPTLQHPHGHGLHQGHCLPRAQLNLDVGKLESKDSGIAVLESPLDINLAREDLPQQMNNYVMDARSQWFEKTQHAFVKFMYKLANDTKENIVSTLVEALFKPTNDVNVYFEGNFAPVDEIGRRVPVEVTAGALPADFPLGVYIRNGPNPQMGARFLGSPFGKAQCHWFEGDGMVHATYFGPGGEISYQNKYIETDCYKIEKEKGKRVWLNTVEGDPKAVAMGYFFNQLRFGKVNKATCNTSIFLHAGRLFVGAEGDLPHEINISDLSTVRVWDWDGEWTRPFTSHPKIVRGTNEMVIFGFAATKPYYMTAVISADGERFIHKCDLELDRCIFSHEVCITERYNLILDWPLTVDVDRLMNGGNLMSFERDTYARVGIMPRFGDVKSVRWFDVEMNYTFHAVNSYEEGEEVVLQGCRARVPFIPSKPGMDKVEWFARAITPTQPDSATDPAIDGALFTRLHEWRFNLRTGAVVERDLTDQSFSLEMPKINEKYVGYKNKYAYANVIDGDASKAVGMPKYGKLVKLYLTEKGEEEMIRTEFYDPGPNIFLSEPLFVGRPGSQEEDDGWIVTYVHDEKAGVSEVYIIDAQKFSDPPVAKIRLPQRVPYGFHSTFIHGAM